MAQVNLSTRIDIETYTRLKEYTEKTKKSLASVTDEAIKEYLDKEDVQKMDNNTKYRGFVKDDLKTLDTKYTKWYNTYQEAHQAAESLYKKTYGARGSVDVESK